MNYKDEALWLLKTYKLYMLCTLILSNLLQGECKLKWTKIGTCGVHNFIFSKILI